MTEWETSSTLLLGLRDPENQAAWERLDRHFRPAIVNFALRFGFQLGDAHDLAQESLLTFVKAYRAGRYDQQRGRLRDWLFGIVKHTAMAARRRLARQRRALPAEDGEPADEQPQPLELMIRLWDEEYDRSLYARALDQVRTEVSDTTWRAFEQHGRLGRPAAEVAHELGLTENAVYLAKTRILRRLRELTLAYEAVP